MKRIPLNEEQQQALFEKTAKYVMKIVNKHHADTNKNVANYRHEVSEIRDEFRKLNNRYVAAMGDFNDKHDSLPSKFSEIIEMIEAHAIGVQNVYNEFNKFNFCKIDKRIEELLSKIKDYELQKDVKEFDLDIQNFPMNIRINMRVKTNFGQCTYSFDYPPALEYQINHIIQSNYINMLNKLYEKHDARGGKYMGDSECKKWFDKHGETIIDLGSDRMKR